ncbi:beta-ketoacyl synthase N-terminal-like domain-containing protein [Taibaiella soli]|nr:beta-ketoacyl synthase N-terminal-like domain-containing protein [Taibaiella soli]
MDLYIHSAGWISAAGTQKEDGFLPEAFSYEGNRLNAQEPDYTGMIPPMQLRRMSKVVRMGIAATRLALKNAGIEQPDAISVGTAMGCLQDTETFLNKLVTQNEQMLTPTAFIQSTHNTVAGQIALLLGCHGHNLTYVHRGHSFEHALINTQLYLQQHPDQVVLAGGLDELINTSETLMQRAGVYTTESVKPEYLLQQSLNGTVAGEGAAFMTVSLKPSANALKVEQLHLFKAKNIEQALEQFAALGFENVNADLVVFGKSGDEHTGLYNELQQQYFSKQPIAAYKHQTGEFGTSSALGLAFITEMVQKNIVPDQLLIAGEKPSSIKKVIFINHYLNHYSCWVLG